MGVVWIAGLELEVTSGAVVVTGSLEPFVCLGSSAFPVTECFELGAGLETDLVGVEMELSRRLNIRKSWVAANCRTKRRHKSACHLRIRDMLAMFSRGRIPPAVGF